MAKTVMELCTEEQKVYTGWLVRGGPVADVTFELASERRLELCSTAKGERGFQPEETTLGTRSKRGHSVLGEQYIPCLTPSVNE